MDEVKEYKYTPSSPRAGHPNSIEIGAPDKLHRASDAPLTANCTSSNNTPYALTVGLVTVSGVRVNYNPLWV